MKHNLKITLILLAMFLITQIIGLAVINNYTPEYKTVVDNGIEKNVTVNQLPYGLQPPETEPAISVASILISMAIAIFLIFILSKIKATIILRLWFFLVVTIALAVSLNALLPLQYSILALVISLPLAFFKIFRQNLVVHNLTELFVYPGVAAIFVPILNIWTVMVLLVIISIYDIYAVWHSGFMQKMAKYQIHQLKIFAGFFVPDRTKKQRQQIKLLRKSKNKKLKNKKIKVSLAILGGGDVVFPIITAGVVLRSLGIWQALIVSLAATLALAILFIYSQEGKFYPAMPFITAGIFLGLGIAYLI